MIHPDFGLVEILDKCDTDRGGLVRVRVLATEDEFWVRAWGVRPARKRQNAKAPRKRKKPVEDIGQPEEILARESMFEPEVME
jgi:hypothetical protein